MKKSLPLSAWGERNPPLPRHSWAFFRTLSVCFA
jgi:hypothetical protein